MMEDLFDGNWIFHYSSFCSMEMGRFDNLACEVDRKALELRRL